MDKVAYTPNYKANYASLPSMSVDPYVQYGLGLQKRWGDRFTGFGQAMIRNGGRNGIALQFGFRWALGKSEKNNNIKQNKSNKVAMIKNDSNIKDYCDKINCVESKPILNLQSTRNK